MPPNYLIKQFLFLLLFCHLLGCSKINNGGGNPRPIPPSPTLAAINLSPVNDTMIWFNSSLNISFSSPTADSLKINNVKSSSVSGTISLIDRKKDTTFAFESFKSGNKNTRYLTVGVHTDTFTLLCNYGYWIMVKRTSQAVDTSTHQPVGPVATLNINCDTTTFKPDWSLTYNWGSCNTFGWPAGLHNGIWHLSLDQKSIDINTNSTDFWKIDTLNNQLFVRYKRLTVINPTNPNNPEQIDVRYHYKH
jgi:hypothetical protein